MSLSSYFRESNFKTLPSWMVGIANLRQRLSKVLFKQIQIELPGLITDINSEMHSCQAELTKLGSVRHTVEEQRLFLVDLSQRFRSVCLNAISGSYDQDFFDEGLSISAQEKRLRAVVRNLEMNFKNSIYENGSKWTIVSDAARDLSEQTREATVDHVLKVLKSSRGCELPGLPSSRLVGILFREYSAPWAGMARQHVSEVWDAVRRFLERTLQYLTTSDVCDSLLRLWFDPLLTEALKNANQKLGELLLVHKREPMTTNHYFYDTALRLKQQRMNTSFETSLKNQLTKLGSIKANDVPAILAAANGAREVDMDRAAAEDALDDMRAYYKGSFHVC